MSIDNHKVTLDPNARRSGTMCFHARSCRPCGRSERERADYRAALIEMAVNICVKSGHDPHAIMSNRKPRWFRYVPGQARRYFKFTVMT